MLKLNNKKESLHILTNYFNKFNSCELGYYLEIENYKNISIPNFLESNIYDSEDIELLNFLESYFKFALVKLFDKKILCEIKKISVKISIVSDSIHWSNIFTIENTIFIKYKYLIDIFEKKEYNCYKSTNDIIFYSDKIYDLEFIEKIAESILYILQFLNCTDENKLENIFSNKHYSIVDKSKINFINKYNILKDPNISFIDNKIIIYWSCDNKPCTLINYIYSNLSFAPYWETKIIELNYIDGEYYEIDQEIDISNEIIDKYLNPFIIKVKYN